ncbi:MAG TPA: DUF1028 domain-containing protein [Thermomicrobiales bacterium]|nr:DUF1028 domain-containing protein [Thermomicrobiales bacterium]
MPRTVNTFSIVARDPATGDLGVAVASKFLAVGAVVPWLRAGVGAIATQAHANVAYGPDGLAMIEAELTAQEVLDRLVAADADRDLRQAGIVDCHGNAASWTGPGCSDWAGGRAGDGFCCQGNILTGPEVVDAMADGYTTAKGAFADRLLTALDAGQTAGGDSRGQQSAALAIVRASGGYGGGNDRWIDLRVDDHPTPITELRRLVTLHRVYFDIDNAELLTLDDDRLTEIAGQLRRIGALTDANADRPSILSALATWAGRENLEERLRSDDQIDRVVVEMLVRDA